jgi:predicted PurR-regulated permease PerM
MNIKKLQLGFFIVFLVAVLVLFFFIAKPYISAIFLALITAALFAQIHERLFFMFGNRKNISALVSVVLVLLVFFVPLAVIGQALIRESAGLYADIQRGGVSSGQYSLEPAARMVESFVNTRIPGVDINLDRFLNVSPYIERLLVWLSNNLSNFFSGALNLTLSAFLYVLCLFYLFRDGSSLTKNILAWSPLFDTHDKLILSKISAAVVSVVRGQLMIGLIQGVLTGFGFWIFGVSHPVIWGAVAAVASLIPAIGTSFVNIPAIIFLLATGQLYQGLGLLVWAAVAVGFVDNLVGPYLINRGVKIHPFLVLISVLGGISFFGPIGFIAGPVVLSLLFALLELYPIIMLPVSSESQKQGS